MYSVFLKHELKLEEFKLVVTVSLEIRMRTVCGPESLVLGSCGPQPHANGSVVLRRSTVKWVYEITLKFQHFRKLCTVAELYIIVGFATIYLMFSNRN